MRTVASLLLPICAVFAITAELTSCKPPMPARVFNAEKGYVKESTTTPLSDKLLVVFVHGIFGTGSETWVNGKNDSLPALVAFDPKFGTALDVLVYQYETPMLNGAGKIPEVADGLSDYLDHLEVWKKYKGVIFVGHSMGGLIIRQLLIAHQADATKVPLIYLYATPTNGAEIAEVASKISHNPQLQGMFPIEASTYLTSVYSNWTNAPTLSKIPTYCSYEGLQTSGIWIVSQSSASALCNQARQQFADHIDIVKPIGREDPRYYLLQLQLLNVLAPLNLLPSPNPSPLESSSKAKPVETPEEYRSPEITGWGSNFSPPFTLCTPDKPAGWTIADAPILKLESTTERGECGRYTTCGGDNTDTPTHACRTISVQGHNENRFDGYGRAVAVLHVNWRHPAAKP
jgi:pimeloyl-ACP methyl ester carboxylesterase